MVRNEPRKRAVVISRAVGGLVNLAPRLSESTERDFSPGGFEDDLDNLFEDSVRAVRTVEARAMRPIAAAKPMRLNPEEIQLHRKKVEKFIKECIVEKEPTVDNE